MRPTLLKQAVEQQFIDTRDTLLKKRNALQRLVDSRSAAYTALGDENDSNIV